MADTDEACSCTLFIRHLPSTLSDDDKKSFLLHFGATHVKVMGTNGKMKHTAFALFENHDCADKALGRLHQLQVMGHRISAEYSSKKLQSLHPKVGDEYGMHEKKIKNDNEASDCKDAKQVENIADTINSIAAKWNIDYPMNPCLRYVYPPPSASILTNIANALASVPKFYVQVLHLMNKMNLPAPFGPITAMPPLPEDAPPLPQDYPPPVPPDPDNLAEHDMEMSSSSESEIESEGDEKEKTSTHVQRLPKKRKAKNKASLAPQLKFQKILDNVTIAKTPGIVQKPEDVFEQPQTTKQKKGMALKIPTTTPTTNVNKSIQDNVGEAVVKDDVTEKSVIIHMLKSVIQKYKTKDDTLTDDILGDLLNILEQVYDPEKTLVDRQEKTLSSVLGLLEKYQTSLPAPEQVIADLEEVVQNAEGVRVQEGGFGKMEPVEKDEQDSESDEEPVEEWGSGKFISSRRLRKGRISRSEMNSLNVFKNYKSGEATTRLYLKNVHSKTTEQDLHYIYGRYVDWENENEKNMFDIRLMKDGRMKGQAFITLGNERQAKFAVEETNRFELNGKPIVVQFARSAKPKETDGQSK